jgi:hypothetical protein
VETSGRKRIGEYLVEKKLLTIAQVEQIVEYGKRENLRFGEAAIALEFLTEDKLAKVFGKNHRVDFFHLDGRFFPKNSRDVLGLETVLRLGVLPLGFKSEYGFFKPGKTLNLGMLDPGRSESLKAAEDEAKKKSDLTRTKVFLVLAEQFLEVLQQAYNISMQDLTKRSPDTLEPTLVMFLEEKL